MWLLIHGANTGTKATCTTSKENDLSVINKCYTKIALTIIKDCYDSVIIASNLSIITASIGKITASISDNN